jgi:hypothetical protein
MVKEIDDVVRLISDLEITLDNMTKSNNNLGSKLDITIVKTKDIIETVIKSNKEKKQKAKK